MLKNSIPFVDLRGKTPMDLLRTYPDKAQELIEAASRTYGAASRAAAKIGLPLSDRYSHAWLKRTGNPYLHEIESMADILEARGVFTLNLCYEWGCTSGVWRTDNTVSLLRVLDWPFPALGKHVVVTHQRGKAGEFYNVTWPGTTGMYNGLAPGRFAAALNQAPMRKHGLGFAGDWMRNRMIAYKHDAIPPAHLLRQVFETAGSYVDAREMLAKTPIAVPAIWVVSGLQPGEGCVIERTEDSAEIFELSAEQYVRTTNHFNGRLNAEGKGWRPREIDSAGRYRHSGAIGGHELEPAHFGWLGSPIINPNTRLCVIADATTRRLMVQGYEGSLPVTELFHMPAVDHEQQQVV